jgi:hypothetical protein
MSKSPPQYINDNGNLLSIQLPFSLENVTVIENGTYVALMVKNKRYKGRKNGALLASEITQRILGHLKTPTWVRNPLHIFLCCPMAL